MSLFSPLPRPPGLPPLLQPNLGPNKAPTKNLGANLDQLSLQQGTGISTAAGGNIVWFPTTTIKEQNKQSTVPHLYPNQNNGRVENTGTDPRKWTVVIPCTNHIEPAPSEKWMYGKLYPQVFNQLKSIFNDGKSHSMQLPDEVVTCKIEDWDWTSTGNAPRDGRIITVQITECIDDTVSVIQTNASTSPLSQLSNTSSQIEGQYVRLTYFNPPGLSLQGLFSQISAFTKQAVAYPGNILASINAQTQQLTSTVAATAGTILTAPATTYNQAQAIYTQNKATIFGVNNNVSGGQNPIVSAINYDQASLNSAKQPFNGSTGFNTTPNSTNPPNIQITKPINYDQQSLSNVHTTFQSLVGTNSTGTVAFTQKGIVFLQALIAYYASLKNIQTAFMQQLLLLFLNQLQQIQSTQPNAKPQYQVMSFVNEGNPISFIAAARFTNNQIDDIMILNPNLSTLCVIPVNSTIQYYSATGA